MWLFSGIAKWCLKMDRFLWANEVRVGCQKALASFLRSEIEIKDQFSRVAEYFEKEFREIERDHKILIHRTKRMEEVLKAQPDVDFNSLQRDIYEKMREVRNKFMNLVKRVRDKE